MRFSIDVRWMVGSFRGMGRYAWQLIKPIEGKIVAIAPSKTSSVNLKSSYEGGAFFPYWEQIVQPRLAKRAGVEYLLLPYNTGPLWVPKDMKRIVVVHDLIFMKSFKELPLSVSLYQVLGRLYRRWVAPRLIKKADFIISVSEYTKNEIIRIYSPKCGVRVIPNSISQNWLDTPLVPLNQRDEYFITVTGEAPSKNLPKLIEAYSLYVNQVRIPLPLKIVGVKESHQLGFKAQAEKYGVGTLIEFVGFVSTDELIKLYAYAKGFIFASLFEGFGIPLIEAMAVGTPIACSNTTSLPEVVGDCAFQFSPYNSKDIANGFLHLTQEHCELDIYVNKGLDRVKEYSEEAISKQFENFWASFNDK